MNFKFKKLTHYLLEHRLQAVLLTFGLTFIPVIGVLGILFAALVTLRKGLVDGAVVTIAATVPYILSFMMASHDPNALPLVLWTAVSVAVASNVLTWVFAVLIYRQMNWSGVLQVAALVGVLVISLIHLAYPDIASWWGEQLTSYYKQAALVMSGVLSSGLNQPSDAQLESISITKYYASGMIVAAVLMNAILQVIAARWWQAIVFAPGILRKELHNIRLSHLAGGLFILSLVFSYMSNSVVLDMMPIIYLLFASAGLSVIHYFFGLMVSPSRWFWIAVLYVALLFAMPTSLVLVAMVALLDVWLDLRKRLRKI
ncbi:MAG TPA: hypothetical protein VL360_06690 [Gammaproteobacteria bacterium]|jgi:hypothetical protein|nr:hypothetical protein [Gammaproteobacteria bacterium]